MSRKEQSPMERTYRFWIYHNGTNVRLSLKVGDTVTLTKGGPTDEGWVQYSSILAFCFAKAYSDDARTDDTWDDYGALESASLLYRE